MLKLFLCAALVAICTLSGHKMADKYKYRYATLEKLYLVNARLTSGLGYVNVSVEQALGYLKNEVPFAVSGAERLLEGEVFACSDKRLTLKQKQLISEYVNSLGISSAENQKKLQQVFADRLNEEIKSAKTISSNFSKLAVRLGFSVGLVLAVIVI